MLYSGRLISDAKLFLLDDPDYDGTDPNNEFTEITSSYHFTQVQPGQVFTFKLEVTNLGTIPAHLKVNLNIAAASNSNLLNVMHIVYTSPVTVKIVYLLDSYFKRKLLIKMKHMCFILILLLLNLLVIH